VVGFWEFKTKCSKLLGSQHLTVLISGYNNLSALPAFEWVKNEV